MARTQDEKGRYRLVRIELSESLIQEALAPIEARVVDLEAQFAKSEVERLFSERASREQEPDPAKLRLATPSGPR